MLIKSVTILAISSPSLPTLGSIDILKTFSSFQFWGCFQFSYILHFWGHHFFKVIVPFLKCLLKTSISIVQRTLTLNKHETSSVSCGGVYGNKKYFWLFLLITSFVIANLIKYSSLIKQSSLFNFEFNTTYAHNSYNLCTFS